MAQIRETLRRVILENGKTIDMVVRDGLLPDHLIIQGMKAEGYRVMTGKDVFPTVSRKLKDYLIRTGIIVED
jgi:hypothetical protein